MKKILAIAMAIVMMMAIAVPAFAAVQYENGTAGSDTVITTKLVKEGDVDPTWYTVSIPASQEIYWEATATTISYKINSQLATGDFVKVSVADSDVNAPDAYKLTKVGSSATLQYDITDKEYTATVEVAVDLVDTVTIDTSMASWPTVPVDTYTDTLTFTAEIV